MKNDIELLAKELFEKLNIKLDLLEIKNVKESNIFNIKIETEESGLIIGPNGKNLNMIENILRLMSSRKVGERIKLHIEVNDYMKTKDERLFDFIKAKIRLVEKNGKDIGLPFYSSYERKKIHGFVGELGKNTISTKSLGEGRERRLYICKEQPKLTIDIDGDDI